MQVKIKYVSLQSQIRGRKFLEEGSAGVYNLRDEKVVLKNILKYFQKHLVDRNKFYTFALANKEY